MRLRRWRARAESSCPNEATGDSECAVISTGGVGLIRHLHNQQEITFRLLADPWRWRERVVEKLTIEDADDVAVTSSYQIRLPQDLIQDWVPEAEPGSLVRVLLPLTTRYNDVLLDVDLVGPEGQHCALLLKHQLARLQANYMAWAARSKHDANRPLEDADELLYAISAYSPAIWNRFWVQSFGRRESVLCDYLSRGLGLRVTLNASGRSLSRGVPNLSIFRLVIK